MMCWAKIEASKKKRQILLAAVFERRFFPMRLIPSAAELIAGLAAAGGSSTPRSHAESS